MIDLPPEPPSDIEDGNKLPLVLVISVSVFMILVSLSGALMNQDEISGVTAQPSEPVSLMRIIIAGATSGFPWAWIFIVVTALAVIFFVAGLALLFTVILKKALGAPILRPSWRFEPKWKLSDVEYLTFFYLLVTFLGGPLILGGGQGIDSPSRWGLLMLLQLSVMIAIYAVTKYRQNDAGAALGVASRKLAWNIWAGFAAFLCYIPVAMAIVITQIYIFQRLGLRLSPQDSVRIFTETDSRAAIAAIVFMAVIIAPLVEELFFRSFLQGMLKKYCGSAWAIFGASLFFAAFHMNLYSLIPLFGFGIFLGYIYDRTQSYAAPVALHMFWNGFIISLLAVHRVIGV